MASVHFADTKNRKPEHISRTRDATVDTVDAVAPRGKSQPSKAVSLQGEPWYNEVVELRRQAHDYKVCNIIRIASSKIIHSMIISIDITTHFYVLLFLFCGKN